MDKLYHNGEILKKIGQSTIKLVASCLANETTAEPWMATITSKMGIKSHEHVKYEIKINLANEDEIKFSCNNLGKRHRIVLLVYFFWQTNVKHVTHSDVANVQIAESKHKLECFHLKRK